MIRKHRKIVNGVEITLLEKTISSTPISDSNLFYSEIENKLKTYLTDQLTNLPSKTTQTSSISITKEGLLGIIGNTPEEGSILSFDGQSDEIVWRQSPNVRLNDIDNTIINNKIHYFPDWITSPIIQIPFAVKWSTPPYHEWGGPGKAGIFWADPWDDPSDYYCIKMGGDNEEIGETGYTKTANLATFSFLTGAGPAQTSFEVPSIGTGVDGGYLSSFGIDDGSMKFANSSNAGRGWVWNVVGGNVKTSNVPRMWLTNTGTLGAEDSIISNKYNGIWKNGYVPNTSVHYVASSSTAAASVGAFHVSGYKQEHTGSWSGQSIISIGQSDLTSAHTNYVLTYEHHYPPTTYGPWTVDPETGEAVIGSITATTTPIGHLVLRPAQGGSSTYVNATAMPEAIHGISAGTTWNNTVQEVLDAILYPYQVPSFLTFTIDGQSTSLEVGASAATGSITFTWSTLNDANINTNSIDIFIASPTIELVTNTSNDGSEVYDHGTGITKTTASSRVWQIQGTDTHSTLFTRNFTVNWYWRFYWGSNAATTMTEAILSGSLQNNQLRSTVAGNYTCDANNYKWICYPSSYGPPSSIMYEGLPAAMESPQTVSVTNAYGETTDYYAYRSTYPSTSAWIITLG